MINLIFINLTIENFGRKDQIDQLANFEWFSTRTSFYFQSGEQQKIVIF